VPLKTPDRLPGVRDEEGIIFETTGVATAAGEIRFTGTRFSMFDTAEYDPATGSGLSTAQHKALLDLVHFIEGPADGWASGTFEEILPAGDPFPTSDIWYEDNTKAKKIVENTTTYNANKTINVDTWKIYDTDGTTVLITLLDTYVYSGGVFPYQITRTWS
jgi:hypothetical protein